MTKATGVAAMTARILLSAGLVFGISATAIAQYGNSKDHDSRDRNRDNRDRERDGHGPGIDKVLYIWVQDQAHVAPDFLAVIDFDEQSYRYGKVIKTVPIPPPGNIGNEPHHCHLNSTKTILGCGGLLSVLKGQNGIFFFDVSEAKNPRFLFSTKAVESSITDDFMPTEDGGFLITQMGAADGSEPGRVAEFDGRLHYVANHFGTVSMFREWPSKPPLDGFNPHGISARPDLNLMMTADFLLPTSSLTGTSGVVLRGSVRVWNYRARKIIKTIQLESPSGGPAVGTMDVKMLPKDPRGYGYTAGMFDGHIYLIDPIKGTGVSAFDLTNVYPHVSTPVIGGMGQIMATPQCGDRLIIGTFMAGQIVMLDTTERANLKQLSVVNLGENSGPHNIVLSNDDNRLVATDYFLNEDDAGVLHYEGDHKVHVMKVTHDTLSEDKRFNLDFNTAFKTGPARPHGIAMK
jgi:56kDa selenium binding protein (SBP56)